MRKTSRKACVLALLALVLVARTLTARAEHPVTTAGTEPTAEELAAAASGKQNDPAPATTAPGAVQK